MKAENFVFLPNPSVEWHRQAALVDVLRGFAAPAAPYIKCKHTMHRILLAVSFSLIALCAQAKEPEYPRDIRTWVEAIVPPESSKGARMVWFYSANDSNLEWCVFTEGDKPAARICSEASTKQHDRPAFTPNAEEFSGATKFAAVDDGWLVAYNYGEFGAALYWFSQDGKRNYKISDHHVVEFFSLSNGVHAIEGLNHLGISKGSVISIERPNANAHWQAISVAKLPFAPKTLSVHQDGTILVVLSDSLVSISTNREIKTLLPDAPWRTLHLTSSVISPDGKQLFIGMRQFVGEFDLITNRFRFLVPSKEFLNVLPQETEKRILKQYGG